MGDAASSDQPRRAAASSRLLPVVPPEGQPLTLLLVDDDRVWQILCKEALGNDYRILCASNGKEAVEIMAQQQVHLVVSDVEMPVLGGYELTAFIKARPELQHAQVILVTAHCTEEDYNRGFDLGVADYIVKPCGAIELRARVRAAARMYRMSAGEQQLLERTLAGVIRLLTGFVAQTDPKHEGISPVTRRVVKAMAKSLNVANAWEVEVAAMIAPLAELTLPVELRMKMRNDPGSLTDTERRLVDDAPAGAAALLDNIPRLERVADMVRYSGAKHRDGGLGMQVPVGARIIHVATDFSALVSAGQKPGDALGLLRQDTKRYDPTVVAAFPAAEAGDAPVRPSTPTFKLPPRPRDDHSVTIPMSMLKAGHKVMQDIIIHGEVVAKSGDEIKGHVYRTIVGYARTLSKPPRVKVEVENQ